MTRRLVQLIAAVGAIGAVVLTAGCGGGDSAQEPKLDPNKLTIYSSQHENLTQAWVDAFTEQTGVQVQVRYGKDSSMGNQLVAEGANSPADVFLTENPPAMTLVSNAGLLAPLDQAAVAGIPETFRPTSKDWVGVAARSTVLVYNPSKIQESQLPKSLMELSQPQWKGQWGAAAAGADFQAIVSAVLATQGEAKTADWLAGLKTNAKIYQNNIATMKAVNAGQVPMGVIYHYYWFRDQALTKEGSKNTKLHFFTDQDPGAFLSVSGAAVLKSSRKAADAQRFVAYLTSADGQGTLARIDAMEFAIGTGVASNPALPALTTLSPPPVDLSTLNGRTVVDLMTKAGIL